MLTIKQITENTEAVLRGPVSYTHLTITEVVA